MDATWLTVSLEALLDRATNVNNKDLDKAAFKAFSALISKEPQAASIALKLIVSKLQSEDERVANQAFCLLETCMENAGSNFQAEVGKFRFLNELIKLVSPKHRKDQTPSTVRNKITNALYLWSLKYSHEFKIKEAYEMLKKQGVIVEDNPAVFSHKVESKFFTENDEKEKLLQQLLQSKKPHDLKAANMLIQNMVKAKEEKEVLDDLKRSLDLKLVTNNVKLLSEMLSMYSPSTSSREDAELVTDLYDLCYAMKPALNDMIMSQSKSSVIYADLLSLNDYMNDTLAHYRDIFYAKNDVQNTTSSLVDFGSPVREDSNSSLNTNTIEVSNKQQSNLDALEEIFNSSLEVNVLPATCNPITSIKEHSRSAADTDNSGTDSVYNKPSKSPNLLFEDLDNLGKSMLEMKVNSPPARKNELSSKLTLNNLVESDLEQREPLMEVVELDKTANNVIIENTLDNEAELKKTSKDETPTSDDDILLLDAVVDVSAPIKPPVTLQPIGEVSVPLVKIVPGNNRKIPAFNDNNEISVEIQLTENKPRDDISVYLVFVQSKKDQPISEFLFQPIVPKEFRLKLQPPTRTQLPPYNPYIPTEVIVQIMLIASIPPQNSIPLKFVISYKIDDETYTEMGQIDELPLRSK